MLTRTLGSVPSIQASTIDGYDVEGFPVRLCFASGHGLLLGMHVFTDANEPEGDDE